MGWIRRRRTMFERTLFRDVLCIVYGFSRWWVRSSMRNSIVVFYLLLCTIRILLCASFP